MKQLLIICLFTFFAVKSNAQFDPELRLKKNGRTVRVYTAGDEITLFVQGSPLKGYITLIKDDSIFINRYGFTIKDFTHIQRRERHRIHIEPKTVITTIAGIGLISTGIAVAKWEPFPKALLYASVIGVTPYLLAPIGRLFQGKRVIKLGDKYQLQTLDLRKY